MSRYNTREYINASDWFDVLRVTKYKKPLPILTFPAVQLLYKTVKELIDDSTTQAMGIAMIADKFDMPIALGYMDLSIEAEAFGARTVYFVDEVPTVSGTLVSTYEEAVALTVPKVGAGRTGINIEGIQKALKLVKDRPVLAECIGPFSLAGRLMDINEAMINCYDEPEMVHILLEKSTEFIINYVNAYKAVGAHGIVMAEPLAGLLSPALAQEFSHNYVKQIVEATQDKDFSIIYHNCGNGALAQASDIFAMNCRAYHFGESVSLEDMLKVAPSNTLVMGNISAAHVFRNGTPDDIHRQTIRLMHDCFKYPNFWPSSGCDIPPLTDLSNIAEFFNTVDECYYRYSLHEKSLK